MSSSLSATASATVIAATNTAVAAPAVKLPNRHSRLCSKASFRLSPLPKLRILSTHMHSGRSSCIVVKSQSNKVSVDGSSNSGATPQEVELKDSKPSNELAPAALATEESISEFLSQVSSLVKLFDSRDIVELQLKQLGCELLIRKKEALPQPPTPAPVMMMHSPSPHALAPPPPPMAAPLPSSPTPSAPSSSSPALAPAAKSANSSFPPFKCPMAGTFYRCAGPGEPPFVKVGDKVQKGQVLCIIEAMKLMNEIEADQAGTVVEVIAEDGKPVSIDTPLFVIEP